MTFCCVSWSHENAMYCVGCIGTEIDFLLYNRCFRFLVFHSFWQSCDSHYMNKIENNENMRLCEYLHGSCSSWMFFFVHLTSSFECTSCSRENIILLSWLLLLFATTVSTLTLYFFMEFPVFGLMQRIVHIQ